MDYTFLILAATAALASYFLDYCLGHPAAENLNPKEIFARYSLWLSERAMKRVEAWYPFLHQRTEAMQKITSPSQRFTAKRQWKVMQFNRGKEYFTYEYAMGMCPVCTNFWLTNVLFLISLIFLPLTPFEYGVGILVSNFLIRIILKL